MGLSRKRAMIRVGVAMAVSVAWTASALAASGYPMTPIRQATPVQGKCMPCQQKCRVCWDKGKSSYGSLSECISACKSMGNPPVVATCGVRARC